MKKIFLAFLILISFYSCSYGAVSEDMNMYVRKDLFEVYMQNINSNFEKVFTRLDRIDENMNDIKKSLANLTERVGRLEEKVDGNYVTLSNRIDGNYVTLSNRIQGVEKRIEDVNTSLTSSIENLNASLSTSIKNVEKRFDDLRYDIYLIIGLLGVLGVLIGMPFVQKWLSERKEAKHNSFTLEDVEKLVTRLIDARLSGKLQ